MEHLIGYARVSTQDQDPQLQLDALSKAGCHKVRVEKASGASASRPVLAKVLEDELREGDTLVVWRLDRLGRSLQHLVETINALEARGVGFRSLTESIDTTTPGGKLTFHLFAALAEFERGLIRERTMAGLAAARANGRVGGRPRKLTPAKERVAARMLAEGMSVTQVASEVGVSRAALHDHLRRMRAAAATATADASTAATSTDR